MINAREAGPAGRGAVAKGGVWARLPLARRSHEGRPSLHAVESPSKTRADPFTKSWLPASAPGLDGSARLPHGQAPLRGPPARDACVIPFCPPPTADMES